MATLPSFVELMASLGLATDGKDADHHYTLRTSHSPSPSPPPFRVPLKSHLAREKSPAIVVSQYDSLPTENDEFKRRASSGSIRSARFSPYSSLSTRRGSMSALSDSHGQIERSKASPSSSRHASSGTIKSPMQHTINRRSRRGSELQQLKIAAASCTPISSFARRRSPQTSPTSPSFSQRSRSTSADIPSPVTLPTLPPMLAETFGSYSLSSASSDMPSIRTSRSPCVSPMELDPGSKAFVRHHQAGLRISSLHRQVTPVS